MTGIELLSTDLSDRLASATPDKRRAAALAASEFAVSQTGLDYPPIEMALQSLRSGEIVTTECKTNLDKLVKTLDKTYFDLYSAYESGGATKEQYLQAFAFARGAAAVFRACDEDTLHAAGDAIYEAAATIIDTDKSRLLEAVGLRL